jgi:glycosyltransferase involved in cell wall biosynthesis
MRDADLVFMGGVIPRAGDRSPVDLTTHGTPDQAANAYQWKFIDGLERTLGQSVRILSAPFLVKAKAVGRRGLVVPGFTWRHAEGGVDASVGFINFVGVRNISREMRIRRILKDFLISRDDSSERKLYVFVYAMHGPFLQQLGLIKRLRPDCHVCLIVPDLPEHMRDSARTNVALRFLKWIDMRRNKSCLTWVDTYVLISAHQAPALGIADDRYVVVEGMVDSGSLQADQPDSAISQATEGFIVVYTGRLDFRYGVGDLVDAMQYIESPDVLLVLCGDGDAVDHVVARARGDARVRLVGQVTHDESRAWQRAADVLINPRPGTADFTRYSFPSKNLEYLQSGRPVLAYRNDGTPSEYNEHLLAIGASGARGIADAIQSVIAMTDAERRDRGESGSRFVAEHKSAESQVAKVLALIGGRA